MELASKTLHHFYRLDAHPLADPVHGRYLRLRLWLGCLGGGLGGKDSGPFGAGVGLFDRVQDLRGLPPDL